MKVKKLVAALILLGTLSTLAQAHHSFAMYDQTKTLTLTGKLTRFILGANHAQLLFELLGPDGKPQVDANSKPIVWGVETGSAKQLAGAGITVETFPYGTIFTVSLSAASARTVTVNFATANGTATAGSDYVATNGSDSNAGTLASPKTAPKMPWKRPRWAGGKRSAITTKAMACMTPAPIPWKPRKTISWVIDWLAPQRAEPARNMTMPPMKNHLRP